MIDDTIYTLRPELYDIIYARKDYRAEALRLAEMLGELGVRPGSRVLEAACGTGNHLVHLQHIYAMAGFDKSPGMVHFAEQKAPKVPLFAADMTSFTVEEPFDALLCLFSSIGYLMNEKALSQAAQAFAAAVRPGGALIIEPWFAPEDWRVGLPHMLQHDTPELKIARVNTTAREGDVAIFDMHWLVAPEGQPVEHFVEHHSMWLCPRETMQRVFSQAGLDMRFEPDGLLKGRGLFLGTRR